MAAEAEDEEQARGLILFQLHSFLSNVDLAEIGEVELEKAVADITRSQAIPPGLDSILCAHGWDGRRFTGVDISQLKRDLASEYSRSTETLRLSSRRSKKPLSALGGKDSETIASVIKSYCPDLLLAHLEQLSESGDAVVACSRSFEGLCMLADISGFTALSASLCNKVPHACDASSLVTRSCHREARDWTTCIG